MKVNQLLLELIRYAQYVALLLLAWDNQLPQHFHDFSIPFGLSDKIILLRQTLVMNKLSLYIPHPFLTLSVRQIPIQIS